MSSDRFVVVGLAPPRASWFAHVAKWATAGTLPVEFVKCLSAEELRARLASGRAFSALLVDASSSMLDRDLVDVAQRAGCAVIAVDGDRGARAAPGLGVDAALPLDFGPAQLLDALATHGRAVPHGGTIGPLAGDDLPDSLAGAGASVATVCGPGGTGASTVAMALAQGLASGQGARRRVVLADLALHAELGMLHDARDVVPGVQELVEAHRAANPAPADVRTLAFAVAERGYDLVLGLRRARAWASLRPRALAAALEGLAQAYDAVVCDTDADFEGQAEGGSVDVEERHLMARSAAARADVLFVVGVPGVKGAHSLARVVADAMAFGVPGERIVPVVNRAPRNPRARAELAAAVSALIPPAHLAVAAPVFLPERHVDESIRDGVGLPSALCEPLAGAFGAVLDRCPARLPASGGPAPVVPGSLGHWRGDDDEVAS